MRITSVCILFNAATSCYLIANLFCSVSYFFWKITKKKTGITIVAFKCQRTFNVGLLCLWGRCVINISFLIRYMFVRSQSSLSYTSLTSCRCLLLLQYQAKQKWMPTTWQWSWLQISSDVTSLIPLCCLIKQRKKWVLWGCSFSCGTQVSWKTLSDRQFLGRMLIDWWWWVVQLLTICLFIFMTCTKYI